MPPRGRLKPRCRAPRPRANRWGVVGDPAHYTPTSRQALQGESALGLEGLIEKREVAADLLLSDDATPEQVEWMWDQLQADSHATGLAVIEGAAHDVMLGPRWERAAELIAAALKP